MIINPQHQPYESIFRPARIWLVLKSMLLSAAAVSFIMVAIYLQQRWLSGTVLCMLMGCLLVCHYNAQRVIIRDKSIVYRNGILSLREQIVPIWHLTIDTRQTLLGRACDYGAVCLYVDDKTILIPQLAMLKQFRNTLIERQNALARVSNQLSPSSSPSLWAMKSRSRFSKTNNMR